MWRSKRADRIFQTSDFRQAANVLCSVKCANLSAIKQQDAVGDLLDFGNGVRGEQEGGAVPAKDLRFEKASEIGGGQRVKASRRLIEEED